MGSLHDVSWSDDVGQGAWLEGRMAGWGENVVTAFVPSGFEAYARVLHPADEPGRGRRLVRWRAVADWSGLALDASAQFHSVALPPTGRGQVPPWSGQGPRTGSLFAPDAAALARLLSRHTKTPDECWFCLWDGYGWQGAMLASEPSGSPLDDPVPAAVREGPRVELPHRRYLLYRGRPESALVSGPEGSPDQTANLWWPADRSWCVASEIDLAWTYVAGTSALVSDLVSDPALEAIPVEPDSPVFRTEPWVERWVDDAVSELMEEGSAMVTTPVGTVTASFDHPRRLRRGTLRTHSQSILGHEGRTGRALARMDEATLRELVRRYLLSEVIGLVGG